MKIEVTEEDIKNGVIRDSARCPITCALRRHIPAAKSIAVFPNQGEIWISSEELQMPAEARLKAQHYDIHGDMDPLHL